MTFHNVRLPEKYAKGFVGGPGIPVEIVRSKGGREQRNEVRSQPVVKFAVDHVIKPPSEFATLRSFWMCRHGRTHSFRLKDWHDYAVTNEGFGTSDGALTTYQLIKTFSDAAGSFVVNMTKPVEGTVVIKANAVTKTEGVDYTINYLTGVLTWLIVPPNGQVLTWTGEFDWCVRFDFEDPNFRWDSINARSWTGMALMGVDE